MFVLSDHNSVNGKKNDIESNNKNIISSRTMNKLVSSANKFYKLDFSIKRSILIQNITSKKINYVRLKLIFKSLLLINKVANPLGLKS